MKELNLNPTWLKTFKTLVDLGHFTQTAKALHMTQPGVTQHIQKLEHACGHDLLFRENKSFSLTEQGRILYQFAKTQQQAHIDLNQALNFDDMESGRCVLACSGSLSLAIFPDFIAHQLKYPNLQIELESAPNKNILKAIEADELDVGVVTSKPDAGRFEIEKIGEESLAMILPKSAVSKRMSPENLIKLGMVRHPDADHYLNLYLSHHKDLANLHPSDIPTRCYINQLQQILMPVAQGIGFTVLPRISYELSPLKEMLYMPNDQQKIGESLYLVTKRHRKLPKRFMPLIEMIKAKVNPN